jgi:hypothetical protein
MGVWHVVKIEWIRGSDTRDNSHLLDSEENEYGPSNIHKLDGYEEKP